MNKKRVNLKPFKEQYLLDEKDKSVNCYTMVQTHLEPYFHFHDEFEMTYVIHGRGTQFVGDYIGGFEAGELLLTGARIPHDRISDKSDTLKKKVVVIHFSQYLIQGIPELKSLSKLLALSKYGLLFENKYLPNKVKALLLEISHVSILQQYLKVLEILEHLSQLPVNQYRELSSISFDSKVFIDSHQHRLGVVSAYIVENLTQKLSQKEVADKLSLTSSSFCRWFKHATGNTFGNYVNKVRIEEACRQLLYNQKTVLVIAGECGFETLSNFNKQFLKEKQCTPRQYRKEKQQGSTKAIHIN